MTNFLQQEIFKNILEYLNSNDWQNISLTCKSWNLQSKDFFKNKIKNYEEVIATKYIFYESETPIETNLINTPLAYLYKIDNKVYDLLLPSRRKIGMTREIIDYYRDVVLSPHNFNLEHIRQMLNFIYRMQFNNSEISNVMDQYFNYETKLQYKVYINKEETLVYKTNKRKSRNKKYCIDLFASNKTHITFI